MGNTTKYFWKGRNKNGDIVHGEQTATNREGLRIKLLQQGIKPLKIRRKIESSGGFLGRNKITSGDISIFARQLATMVAANVPILQALDILIQGEKKIPLRQLFLSIRTDVFEGVLLSDALKKHPKHFDSLFCNLIAIGEQAGTLEILLEQIAVYKEKMESIRKKIKKALFYPAAIISIAMLVSLVLLLFIIPQFSQLFGSFGHKLPLFTRMVVSASTFVRHYWWGCLGGLAAAIWIFKTAKQKNLAFAYFLERCMLKLPIVGRILEKAIIARTIRTLSISLSANIPLVDALTAIANIAGSKIYTDALLQVRDEVATGQPFAKSMQETDLFPNLIIQMITIGSQTGELENMLTKVSVFYEEDINHAVDTLSSLLEPLLMLVLGVIVGGFVIAMYLPIFKLGSIF